MSLYTYTICRCDQCPFPPWSIEIVGEDVVENKRLISLRKKEMGWSTVEGEHICPRCLSGCKREPMSPIQTTEHQ